MTEAIIGILVGVLTVVFARLIQGERWLYSVCLLTLPGFYALFALQAGEHAVGIKEMVFGIPYVLAGMTCVFVSVRKSAVVVGVLWLLHAVFDLAHGHLVVNAGVPSWYPVFCAAVDVVVGLYLLWLSRHVPDANLRKA